MTWNYADDDVCLSSAASLRTMNYIKHAPGVPFPSAALGLLAPSNVRFGTISRYLGGRNEPVLENNANNAKENTPSE